MTVATALAVSWNPLTNSKDNARKRARPSRINVPVVTAVMSARKKCLSGLVIPYYDKNLSQ